MNRRKQPDLVKFIKDIFLEMETENLTDKEIEQLIYACFDEFGSRTWEDYRKEYNEKIKAEYHRTILSTIH